MLCQCRGATASIRSTISRWSLARAYMLPTTQQRHQSILSSAPRPSRLARLVPQQQRRTISSDDLPPVDDIAVMSPAEQAIADVLQDALAPTELLVQDVSGGCGSMYAIEIASAEFKGKSVLQQQRMVNKSLGELVKGWHGVQIRTKVSE